MKPLSERQRAILRAILLHLREYGYAPTIRTVAERVNPEIQTSVPMAQIDLQLLFRLGYLNRLGRPLKSNGSRLARAYAVAGFLGWYCDAPLFDGTPEGIRLINAIGSMRSIASAS